MAKPLCEICSGLSWTIEIQDNDLIPYRCQCFKRTLARSFLGSELTKAPHRKSDLYLLERHPETGEIIGDRTKDDLFIKGPWSEVSGHLRWAVGAKHHDDECFRYKMVGDEVLLRCYLGDFAYERRAKQVRDEIDTFNGLHDLVYPDPLLIVRLGMLAHTNRAAANVLLETLNIRAAESKATWLVEGTVPFGTGHKFYNEEVGRYIQENFEVINVGGDIEAERKLQAQLRGMRLDSTTMDAEESEAPVVPETQECFRAEPNAWLKKKKSTSQYGRKTTGRLKEVDL